MLAVWADLEKQGHEQGEVLEQASSFSVYVPDTCIYHDWSIDEINIR